MKSLLTHKYTEPQLIFRHNICSTGYFSGGLLCVFSNYTPRPHDVLPSAVISYDCHHYDCRETTILVTKLRECHLYHHPHLFVSDLNFISLFRPSCKSFPAADKARQTSPYSHQFGPPDSPGLCHYAKIRYIARSSILDHHSPINSIPPPLHLT